MNVELAFVPNRQAARAGKPCQGALDQPAATAQQLAAIDASTGNAGLNTALSASPAAARVLVSYVGVHLARSLARISRSTFDGHHRIKEFGQRHTVMHFRGLQDKCQRQAVSVCQRWRFVPDLPQSVKFRPVALLFAAMNAMSMHDRLQSMRYAQCRHCRSSWCSLSHTPASCQSRKRFQHFTPEPRTSFCCGSISHRIPERSAKRIPVSAAQFDTQERLPLGLGSLEGNIGLMMDQRSSVTGAFVMPFSSGSQRNF